MYLLQPPVFVLPHLHLTDHRRVHPTILFLATCRTKHCSCHASGTTPNPAHRLRLGAGFPEFGVHYISSSSSKPPQSFLPRKFYFRIPLVSGGLPLEQKNLWSGVLGNCAVPSLQTIFPPTRTERKSIAIAPVRSESEFSTSNANTFNAEGRQTSGECDLPIGQAKQSSYRISCSACAARDSR